MVAQAGDGCQGLGDGHVNNALQILPKLLRLAYPAPKLWRVPRNAQWGQVASQEPFTGTGRRPTQDYRLGGKQSTTAAESRSLWTSSWIYCSTFARRRALLHRLKQPPTNQLHGLTTLLALLRDSRCDSDHRLQWCMDPNELPGVAAREVRAR